MWCDKCHAGHRDLKVISWIVSDDENRSVEMMTCPQCRRDVRVLRTCPFSTRVSDQKAKRKKAKNDSED